MTAQSDGGLLVGATRLAAQRETMWLGFFWRSIQYFLIAAGTGSFIYMSRPRYAREDELVAIAFIALLVALVAVRIVRVLALWLDVKEAELRRRAGK